MYKSIVIVATLAALLLAVACGSGSGSDGAPAAAGTTGVGTAGVGDTVRVAGGSSQLEIALEETKWLPEETAGGAEVRPPLFGVKLAVRNLTGSFYDDAISLCAVLTDTTGRTHDVAWELIDERDDDFRDVLEGVRIPAGGERTGWVYFALDPEVTPSTLRFTAEAGFGPETGVWSLE
jgi:hypothetical protein